jgi:hypothetical protein
MVILQAALRACDRHAGPIDLGPPLRRAGSQAAGPRLPPATNLQGASQQARDSAALASWARGQRLYYGDLLGPSAAARLEQLLAAAGPAQAEQLVATLRQLHAVAQPGRYRSVTQQEYGPQYSTQVRGRSTQAPTEGRASMRCAACGPRLAYEGLMRGRLQGTSCGGRGVATPIVLSVAHVITTALSRLLSAAPPRHPLSGPRTHQADDAADDGQDHGLAPEGEGRMSWLCGPRECYWSVGICLSWPRTAHRAYCSGTA